MKHIPVMFKEVMRAVGPSQATKILDCTFGLGGHTKEFLSCGARVVGLDRDYNAVRVGQMMSFSRLNMVHGKFSQIHKIFHGQKFNAIFFDLGVSSPQIDDPNRGMSFKQIGPLSMCMGLNNISAYEFVNYAPEATLAEIIYQYGEERQARRIAAAIVSQRQVKLINTTKELAEIVQRVVRFAGGIDPATKTFQAIRIFVNNELDELAQALQGAIKLLDRNGVICCISFHSLEDRIVKHFFKNFSRKAHLLTPSVDEIAHNPRARSAKFRWHRFFLP